MLIGAQRCDVRAIGIVLPAICRTLVRTCNSTWCVAIVTRLVVTSPELDALALKFVGADPAERFVELVARVAAVERQSEWLYARLRPPQRHDLRTQ